MEFTNRAKEVFGKAHEMPPTERRGFLANACAGDPALRAEVEALLAAFDSADDLDSSRQSHGLVSAIVDLFEARGEPAKAEEWKTKLNTISPRP